ncbi:hypothetical protein KHEC_DIPIPN_03560 [Escherichia coli]
MQTTRTPYSISFMATVLLLLLFACHSTIANAAVALGATRVIYPANQKQVLLPVTNNDPASVYLIQSWIENAGDQKDTQFVITPPLFSIIAISQTPWCRQKVKYRWISRMLQPGISVFRRSMITVH